MSVNNPDDKIEPEEEPKYLNFDFTMPHYKGNIENIEIPSIDKI